MKELSEFAKKHNIPTAQTVMGYSTMKKDDPYFLGADWWIWWKSCK